MKYIINLIESLENREVVLKGTSEKTVNESCFTINEKYTNNSS